MSAWGIAPGFGTAKAISAASAIQLRWPFDPIDEAVLDPPVETRFQRLFGIRSELGRCPRLKVNAAPLAERSNAFRDSRGGSNWIKLAVWKF